MKKFTGIIAIAENRVIGLQNTLPWPREYSDLKFFKEKTWGGRLIMGRKTFQGLGVTWLPNREIFVLTKFNPFGWVISECNFGVGKAKTHICQVPNDLPDGDYWVAGGKSVYDLFMPQITEFYVTYIRGVFEGDVTIPAFEHLFPNQEEVKQTDKFRIVRYWK